MSCSKTAKRPPSNEIIVLGRPCKQSKFSNSQEQMDSHLDSQASFSDSDYSGSTCKSPEDDVEFMELDENSTSPLTDSDESCSGDSGFQCNGIHPVDILDEDAKPTEEPPSPKENGMTSSAQPEETLKSDIPTNVIIGDNYVRLPRPILWSW